MGSSIQLPKVGDRVGFVCGPGDFAREGMCATGTVTRISSDQWYDHIAHVAMDEGGEQTVIGGYTTIGIGAYLLRRTEVAA